MVKQLPIGTEVVSQLKKFIELCQKTPEILHHPDLSFFKNYMESLGAQIPKHEEPDSEESDLELDTTNVIGKI